MPAANRTVRVFISSTFRDMHAERDHLVTVVFPELRERVEQLGLEFFDVDLRWGVPETGVDGEKANSWEYCRRWIDRVEPFFVCMLGQRYGWVPQPHEIKDDNDRKLWAGRSVTDMEIRHAVLSQRVRRRSSFYLRATLVPEPPRTDPAIYGEFVDTDPISFRNLEQLKTEIRTCGRPVRPYACRWTGKSFEDLDAFGRLVLDDLWSGVLRDERYVSKDVWRQALGADPEADPRYTDESRPVPPDLAAKLVALAKPPPKDPLDTEREQMEAFAQTRLRWFQGRTYELQQLTDFIQCNAEDAPRLAVVAAAPGQGKSALLARLWQDLLAEESPKDGPRGRGASQEEPPSSGLPPGGMAAPPSAAGSPPESTLRPPPSTSHLSPSTFVIAHFVGATERSASAHALVERLLGELDRSGIAWPADEQKEGEEPKRDFNSLCLRFAQRLGDYAGEMRIVILLDALNQLTDGHDLHWLPNRLGPSVRVIVSCIADATLTRPAGHPLPSVGRGNGEAGPPPEHRVLQALASRQPAPLRVPLGPLTADDVRTIVVAYLEEYCKELDTAHVDALCRMPQARNPLYLLVMLAELRTLGGNDMNVKVPGLIASMAEDHPDTVSLFKWVLERMENAEGFGKEALRWWCLYLAHGRVGMASQELADLLARKLGVDAAATALRIERGLRRYLLRRGGQLDFFHSQLRQAVMEQYGPHAKATSVHGEMADYFRDMADPARTQSWKGESPRPFLEVVFHLVKADSSDDYCQILCDLRFVEARCRLSQVFELIADYRLAQENLPEAQADLREDRERQERIAQWTRGIIEYARQWSDRRDRTARRETVTEPEPVFPEPPPSCRMWTEEEIQAECDRIIRSPTRRDRLKAFADFVNGQCYPLLEHGKQLPGFVLQHAFNNEPAGGVHDAAVPLLVALSEPHLLRRWPPEARPNSKPALLRTLIGHSRDVTCVSVTPDGRWAVSGSGNGDNTVRVWGLEDGVCLHTLKGHTTPISVCLTPDGRRAVSASSGQIRVWDLQSGACLRVLTGHDDQVVDVTPDGRRAVSGSMDKTLRVWDLDSGTCLHTLAGHGGWVESVRVTPDGRRAVSGSWDKTLRVWDLDSGTCLHTLTGHSATVRSVSVTPDGRLAVSGSDDYTVRVWDLENGVCLRTLERHSGVCLQTWEGCSWYVRSVSVTPDGLRAVSGSLDNTVRVWDLGTGRCLRVLTGHSGGVSGVSMTPDGLRAVSGSADYTVRVWDLGTGLCLRLVNGHSATVGSVSVTSDGRRAISGSDDKMLRVWDPRSGVSLRTLEGHSAGVNRVNVAPDGRHAVSGSEDKTLRVWDIESGACLRTLEGHSDEVGSVSVTPDGRYVVSGSGGFDGKERALRVWAMKSGVCLRTLTGHRRGIDGLSVTPDGRQLVSWSTDRTVRVWDMVSGQCLRMLRHSGWVESVSLTPEGRRAISGAGGIFSTDYAVRVWNLDSGRCLRRMTGHSDSVDSVSVTPDGQRAVSGSVDHTLRVWDLKTGACLHRLLGHSSIVSSVRVTLDGRRAVSVSGGQIRVWDLESGQCLGVYSGSVPFSSSAALDGSGGVLCAGTVTGEVLFLELHGFLSGPSILTAQTPQQARCPVCGHEFAPPPPVAAAIEEITHETQVIVQKSGARRQKSGSTRCPPPSAFLSTCPHCQHPLQFNPFFSVAEDYAEVLRRGLESSRREKGNDHEETLAHLVALAVHLENAGKPEEATAYKREHDEIAARKKEKPAGS